MLKLIIDTNFFPESTIEEHCLTREDCFVLVKDNVNKDISYLSTIIVEEVKRRFDVALTLSKQNKKTLYDFFYTLRKKWKECNRYKDFFYKKHEQWLHQPLPLIYTNEVEEMDVSEASDSR